MNEIYVTDDCIEWIKHTEDYRNEIREISGENTDMIKAVGSVGLYALQPVVMIDDKAYAMKTYRDQQLNDDNLKNFKILYSIFVFEDELTIRGLTKDDFTDIAQR